MKKTLCGALASLSLFACGGDPQELLIDTTTSYSMSADEVKGSTLNRQLAQARAATAQYHDVNVAIADGYAQASPCVASPAGAMGFHYVNFSLMRGAPSIERPQALLYLPDGEGGLRLVGVEYISPVMTENGPYFGCGAHNASCPPENPSPAPELFDGVPFAGPFPPRSATAPWTYEQHVWIWAHNPSGTFAPFNPSLTCDPGAASDDGHDHG